MIESPAKLREICQKPNYRTVGNWMARHITRDLAIYGTWLVLHTRMRADSVALISLVCGFASALLVAIPNAGCLLAGALLLQFWYFLDHVDGQVARYYKEADLTGTFFDFMIHFFVHSSVLFGLGIRMFAVTGSYLWLMLAFLSALAMGGLSQFNDCKCKAFFLRLSQWQGSLVRLGAPVGQDVIASPPQVEEALAFAGIPKAFGSISCLKKIYVFLYKLTEIHVFMNILTATAALQLFFHGPWASVFILLYACLLPAVLVARMTHTMRTHRIDSEFAERFISVEGENR